MRWEGAVLDRDAAAFYQLCSMAALLRGGAPLVKAHQQRLAASVGSSCERCVELQARLLQPPGLWDAAGEYFEDDLPVRKQHRTLRSDIGTHTPQPVFGTVSCHAFARPLLHSSQTVLF
jgi:hypothetical protein